MRDILVKILNIFHPDGMLGSDVIRGPIGILFFIFAILFCWLWGLVSWGFTVYTGIIRGFNMNFIYGLLLIIPAFLLAPWSVLTQILQFIATFSVLPLIVDPHTIRNIISCNQEPLSYLFAGLCICGSGNVFDNTTVAVMVVFYIIFALKALIFN